MEEERREDFVRSMPYAREEGARARFQAGQGASTSRKTSSSSFSFVDGVRTSQCGQGGSKIDTQGGRKVERERERDDRRKLAIVIPFQATASLR